MFLFACASEVLSHLGEVKTFLPTKLKDAAVSSLCESSGCVTVTEVFFDTLAKSLLVNAGEPDGRTMNHHACGSCSLQTALPMLPVLLLA